MLRRSGQDGDRDVVSDRAVGSVFVVVSTPILQLFAGVGKAHEPVGVQAFRSELAVERLDEAVVGGLDRRAVPRHAVLRRSTDDVAPAQRWPCGEREAHPSAHAADGPYADLPETQHQQADERAQNLSLPFARAAGGQAKPGLVRGHYLFADASRVPLSGGNHGLAYPDGSIVADLEHAGRGLLRRGAERGDLPVRTT